MGRVLRGHTKDSAVKATGSTSSDVKLVVYYDAINDRKNKAQKSKNDYQSVCVENVINENRCVTTINSKKIRKNIKETNNRNILGPLDNVEISNSDINDVKKQPTEIKNNKNENIPSTIKERFVSECAYNSTKSNTTTVRNRKGEVKELNQCKMAVNDSDNFSAKVIGTNSVLSRRYNGKVCEETNEDKQSDSEDEFLGFDVEYNGENEQVLRFDVSDFHNKLCEVGFDVTKYNDSSGNVKQPIVSKKAKTGKDYLHDEYSKILTNSISEKDVKGASKRCVLGVIGNTTKPSKNLSNKLGSNTQTIKTKKNNCNLLLNGEHNSSVMSNCNENKGKGSDGGYDLNCKKKTMKHMIDPIENIIKSNRSRNFVNGKAFLNSESINDENQEVVFNDLKCKKKVQPQTKKVLRAVTKKPFNSNSSAVDKVEHLKSNIVNNDCSVLTIQNKSSVINNSCEKMINETDVGSFSLNSALENKVVYGCEEPKQHKVVHFTPHINKITPKKVCDFFHDDKHKKCHKSRSCEVIDNSIFLDKTKKINIYELNENNKSDINIVHEDKSRSKKNHVPIYKKLANSRKSYRLTPPKVENKDTLYEFEIDENEEPRVKKKRRQVKTYKRRKRVGFECANIKLNELNDIPKRTMILRIDDQINDKVSGASNHNNTVNLIESPDLTDLEVEHETLKRNNISTNNQDNTQSKKRQHPVNNTISNKTFNNKQNRFISKNNINEQNAAGTSHNLSITNKYYNHIKKFTKQNSEIPDGIDFSNNLNENRPNDDNIDFMVTSNDVNNISNSTVVTQPSGQMNNTTICSSNLNSPLHEYSRLHDGIQVGPVYSSPINCSVNNFVRGLTASTPFRTSFSPARIHNFRQRREEVSSNKYVPYFIHESENEDEQNEFFGFNDNECSNDICRNDNLSSKTPINDNRVLPLENIPVQKISIREVIALLKKDNEKLSKSEQYSKVHFKPIFHDCTLECCGDSLNETSCKLYYKMYANDTGQESICLDKNLDKEKTFVEINGVFKQPPRRSYTDGQRIKKRVVYDESETHEETTTDDEKEEKEKTIRAKSKRQKKTNQKSKKQVEEWENFAAAINSQFKEIEQSKLCVE